MSNAYFIGIDIGTQGARAVILDETGEQAGGEESPFLITDSSREEQSPVHWWDCCMQLIPALLRSLPDQSILQKIRSIAVSSTSGTIIPLAHDRQPLHPAIMYSDPRSATQAAFCKKIAAEEIKQGYKAFNASSGLPKMRWFLEHFPAGTRQLFKFIHAADFITGRLCGEYSVTDHTNALKSGYDLHRDVWPDYVIERIGIAGEWLQQVQPSGEPIGTLRKDLAKAWHLPQRIIITTGITDGCASQVAAGAMSPGQWNTTIGTTLVIKGVTRREIDDPTGAIYNHRHPAGFWMPGGASNTGADWVSRLFAGEDLQQLASKAATQLPSPFLAWPLLQKGERFPFVAPQATGFWPEGDKVQKFAACMEGVAFIERYAYENIARLSSEAIDCIFSAGGASNSDTWLRIRSSVIDVPVLKVKNVSGAAGAAILASSRTYYSSLQEAARSMVKIDYTVEPEPRLVNEYEEKYGLFIDMLREKEIIA